LVRQPKTAVFLRKSPKPPRRQGVNIIGLEIWLQDYVKIHNSQKHLICFVQCVDSSVIASGDLIIILTMSSAETLNFGPEW